MLKSRVEILYDALEQCALFVVKHICVKPQLGVS
jgi:hypothetical protein